MRQNILFSFLLHFIIIIVMVISAPFKPKVRTDIGEVIKVNLASLPALNKMKQPDPMTIPAAILADEPVIRVVQTSSITKAKKVAKPKPEIKKDKTYKPQAEKSKTDQTGTEESQKDISEDIGTGSKFSGAAIDNTSFNYSYWFVQAFGKIERNWSNPVFANQPIMCIIYFQVIRSGRIIKIEIEESSGIDAFDRACERAVKLSQPLPPLPDDFAEEIIGIHLEFPYSPG